MEYKKYTQIGRIQWDDYIDKLNDCPFNYTSHWIEFSVEYSIRLLSNEAFLLMEGQKIIGAAAIFLEISESGEKTISWNGGYCMAPYIDASLSYKEQERYAQKMMQYIEEVANKNECSAIWLRLDPLSNPAQSVKLCNYNYLLKYHYMDYSSLSQIIDLQKSKEELQADLRENHKRNIKKGKDYKIEIYNATNIGIEQIQLYKEIYEADAGKVTRNSELYMHYFYFVQGDCATLLLAKKDEKYVAALISTQFHDTAYYSSYGELTEELDGNPVGHRMHWEMMLYLKEKGIKYYEIGEQVYGETFYSNPEQKLINISLFKRGFGGYTVPFWRGKKTIVR